MPARTGRSTCHRYRNRPLRSPPEIKKATDMARALGRLAVVDRTESTDARNRLRRHTLNLVRHQPDLRPVIADIVVGVDDLAIVEHTDGSDVFLQVWI